MERAEQEAPVEIRGHGLLEALHARLFPPEEQQAPAKTPAPSVAAAFQDLTDAEVLRRAMSSNSGERFARLWSGDRSGYASIEADLETLGYTINE